MTWASWVLLIPTAVVFAIIIGALWLLRRGESACDGGLVSDEHLKRLRARNGRT